MQLIKNYVSGNSTILFKHHHENNHLAFFDNKGFFFTDETQNIYNQIKNQPHLYVAWTNHANGYYYIGKSFQNGGRWKRQHAYHLGTLAHHLLNTIRYDDQNHAHWIEHWMNTATINAIGANNFSISLQNIVCISFIPFEIYSNQNFINLEKSDIRKINTETEYQLIKAYQSDNMTLLNIQGKK